MSTGMYKIQNKINTLIPTTSGTEWPPQCCVAAFVEAALAHFGYANISRPVLAYELRTCVGPHDANPWKLRVSENALDWGVSVFTAVERISVVLESLNTNLAFRHIPFTKVTMGLYESVITQALERNCVLGVGFNYMGVIGVPGIERHVARVSNFVDEREVVLVDDSEGRPPCQMVIRWADLEAKIHEVKDGFWIVGPKKLINLDYT